MKIISFSSGILISLFRLEAFTPIGGQNERQVIGAIAERYNFGTSPNVSSRAELERNGLVYELGFFETELGEATIHRLSIHNDGVIVRANKTGDAEVFFDDLTNWLVEGYGCREVNKKSLYSSDIVVEFEKPAKNIFAKYDKMVDIILSSVDEHREVSAAAFNGLIIEFEGKSTGIPKFIIERREGTSIKDECYFCSAPLSTERHLQTLEEIERLCS